jgi:WD40 repeat protein
MSARLAFLLLGAFIALMAGYLSPGVPTQAEETKTPRTDDYGDPLPPGVVRRLGTNRLCHGNFIGGLAFSPDGRWLLSWDYPDAFRAGNTFCLWDAATGKPIRRFGGAGYGIYGVDFSADGKLLACVDAGGNVRVWALPDGKLMHELHGERDRACCVCFARAAPRLATAGYDHTARVWDAVTGRELHRFPLFNDHFHTLIALSPDATRLTTAEAKWVGGKDLAIKNLATAEAVWDVRIRDVKSGKELTCFTPSTRFHPEGIHSGGQLSPDGTLLAMKMEHGAHLWDLVAGEKRFRFPPLGWDQQWGIVFSADGKTITSTEEKGAIHLWDTATCKERPHLPLGNVDRICLSADGKLLATSSLSGVIRIWEVAGWKERLPMVRQDGTAEVLSFSPDGKTLASRARFGKTIVWEVSTGKALSECVPCEYSDECFQFAPDGHTLAMASQDGLFLYDVPTGKEFPPPEGHKGAVHHVSFSPDGKLLASAGADGTIRLWDIPTRKQIRSIWSQEGKGVAAVAFAPDGRHLASWEKNGTIWLWEAATGKPIRALASGPCVELPSGHPRPRFVFLFSPDGRWLLGASFEGCFLLDVLSGRHLEHFPVEELGGVLSFSPDGKLLTSGGHEGPLSVWEIASGKKVLEVPPPGGQWYWLTAASFAPDGKTLAWSASPEEAILIGDFAALLGDGRPPPPATPRDFPRLWDALSGEDAGEAYRAIERLAAAPREVVPFLKEQLRPVAPIDAGRLARLIADLNQDDFAVRERATSELKQMGEQAAAGLRRALEGHPSAEVRRRARALLEKLETEPGRRLLTAVRATVILERLGTPEARQLLRKLAEGATEVRLTQEAKATLERLKHSGGPGTK